MSPWSAVTLPEPVCLLGVFWGEIFRLEAELGKNFLHRDPLATALRKPSLAGV
jgi:hypothetical protein